MQVSVYTVPAELICAPSVPTVVIDVLRATSVMVTAMENGAADIRPVRTVEEAIALREPGTLLGGERRGLLIEGFDLDNSPLSYARQIVAGKHIVMTTTNGTQALCAVQQAPCVYLACLRNVSVVAEALGRCESAAILCAGTKGQLSLDDLFTAGAILHRLQPDDMNDAARLALMLYQSGNAESVLSQCRHYRYLQSIRLEGDLRFCLRMDAATIVPVFENGLITVKNGANGWRNPPLDTRLI